MYWKTIMVHEVWIWKKSGSVLLEKKKKNQPERPEIKEATEGTFQNHESGQKSHGTWPGFDPGEEETGASQSRGRGSEGKAELISDCASEVAEKMYSYPLFTEAY